ncbi:MAG: hypothetical protein ACJA0K_001557 [Maricaulis maris]|jgi:hypothetical protein
MHQFEFDLDVREQMAVSRRLGSRVMRPLSQLLMFAVMLVVGFGMMFALFGLAYFLLLLPGWQDFAFFLAIPLFFLFWRVVGIRLCQAVMRNVTQADEHQGERVQVTVSGSGVNWTAPGFKADIEWKAVDAVYDEREAVMFRLGPLCYFVPSRLFPTPAARTALLETCRSALRPEALARSRFKT